MSGTEPTIDFTQIEFPSDQLTVKDLRRAIPHSFDLPAREGYAHAERQGFLKRESLENYLGGILNAEREIAALAFNAALGREAVAPVAGPRWSAVQALVSDYTTVGLARGEHHGQELVHDIETQAQAQAKRHLGPMPPR